MDGDGRVGRQIAPFDGRRVCAEIEGVVQPDAPDGDDVGAAIGPGGGDPVVAGLFQPFGGPGPGQQAFAFVGRQQPVAGSHCRAIGCTHRFSSAKNKCCVLRALFITQHAARSTSYPLGGSLGKARLGRLLTSGGCIGGLAASRRRISSIARSSWVSRPSR